MLKDKVNELPRPHKHAQIPVYQFKAQSTVLSVYTYF